MKGVEWSGLTATVAVSTEDGSIPPVAGFTDALTDLPDNLSVVVDVGIASHHEVR